MVDDGDPIKISLKEDVGIDFQNQSTPKTKGTAKQHTIETKYNGLSPLNTTELAEIH